MTEDSELEMIKRLDALRMEHRRMDREIYAMSKQNPSDQFNLFRLKKHKLALRDKILELENKIYPDIIA